MADVMRKIMCVVLAASLLAACAQPKTIDGVTYGPYGLLNSDDMKNDNIRYEVVWGNVIWACILMETVVFPVYFFGFSLFQPVGKKTVKGAIDR